MRLKIMLSIFGELIFIFQILTAHEPDFADFSVSRIIGLLALNQEQSGLIKNLPSGILNNNWYYSSG